MKQRAQGSAASVTVNGTTVNAAADTVDQALKASSGAQAPDGRETARPALSTGGAAPLGQAAADEAPQRTEARTPSDDRDVGEAHAEAGAGERATVPPVAPTDPASSEPGSGASTRADEPPAVGASADTAGAGTDSQLADGRTAAVGAHNVSTIMQAIWQLQEGCQRYCFGTSLTQSALQEADTAQTALAVASGPPAASAQALNEARTVQFIWQRQLGCVAFCYGTSQAPLASQSAHTSQAAIATAGGRAEARNIGQYDPADLPAAGRLQGRVPRRHRESVAAPGRGHDADGGGHVGHEPDRRAVAGSTPEPPAWLLALVHNVGSTIQIVLQHERAACLDHCAGESQRQEATQPGDSDQRAVGLDAPPSPPATPPSRAGDAPGADSAASGRDERHSGTPAGAQSATAAERGGGGVAAVERGGVGAPTEERSADTIAGGGAGPTAFGDSAALGRSDAAPRLGERGGRHGGSLPADFAGRAVSDRRPSTRASGRPSPTAESARAAARDGRRAPVAAKASPSRSGTSARGTAAPGPHSLPTRKLPRALARPGDTGPDGSFLVAIAACCLGLLTTAAAAHSMRAPLRDR